MSPQNRAEHGGVESYKEVAKKLTQQVVAYLLMALALFVNNEHNEKAISEKLRTSGPSISKVKVNRGILNLVTTNDQP